MSDKTSERWTLSQEDAEQLITEMKNTIEHEFVMPAPGEQNSEFHVLGKNSRTEYAIALFRGKRDPNKHSISARINKTGTQLMRLCVQGAPHTNPDGTRITGAHLHIYREGYDTRYAKPVNIQSPDFVADTILLLKEFNVISMPTFQDGIEVGI